MGKVVKNISWTFLSTIIVSLVQVIQLGVLAHHVPVSDMGVLSLIYSIINVAVIFQDVGFSSFLIYKQNIKETQRHCLFTLNVIMGFVLFALAISTSRFFESWFVLKDFAFLFSIASLNFIFMALGSQSSALLIKEKRLSILAQMEIFSKSTSMLVMLLLLWMGYGVLSQIIALLVGTLLFSTCAIWANKSTYSVRFSFSWSELKEPFAYGGYHLGSIFIGEFRKQMDVFIAAKFLSADMLGLYSVAKELAMKSIVIIRPVMVKVAMPIFSEQQEKVEVLRAAYLKTNYYIALLYGAAATVAIVFSSFILETVYGEEYISAQYIFIIFMVVCFLRCIGLPLGVLAQAVGRTAVEFRWNIISTLIFITFMLVAALWNVDYLAQAVLGAQLLLTLLSRKLFLGNFFEISFKEFAKSWSGVFIFISSVAVAVLYFNV